MTRTELAQEFILEMEIVLDNMTPLDKEHAKDRLQCKRLLTEAKTDDDRATILALYLATVADKSEVVNSELTANGRAGDKVSIAKWSRIAGLVLQLNRSGGSYGRMIGWSGLKMEVMG
jgi:hypothetical protein